MKTFEANSIDSIVTDPPYGFEFMGKEWDHGIPGVPFWSEMLRVAKPGAMLLAFGGTRTHHRLMVAIEDAGWEIRDCLMWLYGSGFPKSMDISKAIDKAAGAKRKVVGVDPARAGRLVNQTKQYETDAGWSAGNRSADITEPATDEAKQWDGWGTALKPAWEPIVLAMKPLDGTYVQNAEEYGVAGLNIDGCRIQGNNGKHRENEPTQDTRYTDRGGTNFALKPGPRGGDPAGRWPANLILDEEAGQLLDEQTGILTSGKCPDGFEGEYKAQVYAKNIINPETVYADSGGASRFFYCAKASKKEKGKDNIHPTVKPLALMEYLIRLTMTPTGGVVLDPFAGSGSTLVACKNVGRPFIGIEQNEEYIPIIKKRLAA